MNDVPRVGSADREGRESSRQQERAVVGEDGVSNKDVSPIGTLYIRLCWIPREQRGRGTVRSEACRKRQHRGDGGRAVVLGLCTLFGRVPGTAMYTQQNNHCSDPCQTIRNEGKETEVQHRRSANLSNGGAPCLARYWSAAKKETKDITSICAGS